MSSTQPSPVAERIRQTRLLAGISARELARLAGLQPSHASLIESGTVANVRVDTLAALARALGCSLDWLVNGDGDAPTEEMVRGAVLIARGARTADDTAQHVVAVDDTGTS